MTSWASPTASSWRSSACTIACSNHRQKRPLFLSPHPETAVRPAFQPSCKILRQSLDFSAFSNQRSSCRLSPYGPNADLLDSVPGCGRRVSSIKSEKTPVRRRDGRVAEGARLESVYTGNRIGGSNPSLSASFSFAVSTPEYYLRSRSRPLSALSSVLNMVRGLGPFGDTIGCPGMLHSRFRIVFFLLLALTSGRGVWAQTSKSPHAIVLHAARLLDVENGRVLSPGEVLVEGERIVEAGASVKHSAGEEIIDLGDRTLLPGLIDAHIHLLGGHEDAIGYNPEQHVLPNATYANNADQLVEAMREQFKQGADFIKIYETGPDTVRDGRLSTPYQYTETELSAAVREAARVGKRVAVHATGEPGALYAAQAGVASVDHAFQLSEATMRLMRQKHIFAVPTFTISEYFAAHAATPDAAKREQELLDLHAQEFRKQLAAGVSIALGSDVGPFPHGTQAREFVLMVKYGMSPLATLQADLINGAKLLEWEGQIGTLKPGYLADIIAVPGNPLDDISTLQ